MKPCNTCQHYCFVRRDRYGRNNKDTCYKYDVHHTRTLTGKSVLTSRTDGQQSGYLPLLEPASPPDDKVAALIKKQDLNRTTPIKALTILEKLQKMLTEEFSKKIISAYPDALSPGPQARQSWFYPDLLPGHSEHWPTLYEPDNNSSDHRHCNHPDRY